MEILQHVHSVLRWALLLLLIMAIVKSFSGWKGKKAFTDGDRKVALFTVIFAHTQLVIGLVLYIMGKWYQHIDTTDEMVKSVHRFFAMEHSTMMILAIAFITIGSVSSKKASAAENKHKRIFAWFLTALMLILAAIPWPFMMKFANLSWY
ncbi:MAG: cytochrome B [Bacteroidetes bacterium]|nr:cytochrome B [Bacteroidota bacterium]